MAKRPKIDKSYEEIEQLINSWILSERNRKLMKRRLLDGIIFDKLSGLLNDLSSGVYDLNAVWGVRSTYCTKAVLSESTANILVPPEVYKFNKSPPRPPAKSNTDNLPLKWGVNVLFS